MPNEKKNTKEQTLIILKPDAIQRGLIGEIMHRFERKGLAVAGLKMIQLNDILLNKHYKQHIGKPFLPRTIKFMKLLPVVVIVLQGLEVVRVVRAMCGPTDGNTAPVGTIRGDFSMTISNNIVHSSEDVKSAKREIGIFFKSKELFSYKKPDWHFYYNEEEHV